MITSCGPRSDKPIIFHIPVCPFSQRLEILLELKGARDSVDFHAIDITQPRPSWLLEKTQGSTSLPVLDLGNGKILKESLVILRFFDESIGGGEIARSDPFERAIERLFITKEGPFTMSGYLFVMNQEKSKRDEMMGKHLEHYKWLNDMLVEHNRDGTWLFEDRFGLAEVVYTPMFARFWFLEYYEEFKIPDSEEYARVRKWRDACLAHPCAQQVTSEEINKLYYDYALGCGNGKLPEGRKVSSFTFEPRWQDRPMPPRDKFERIASDEELGLLKK